MQTSKIRKWLAAIVVLLVLAAINIAIWQKEQLLKSGAVIILQLAPVDPRSLMQGDYMALDYALTRSLREELNQWPQDCSAPLATCHPARGNLIVKVDAHRYVTQGWFDKGDPLKPDELRVRYHINAGSLAVGTNAYFFQEGHAERFASARYGQFRVGADGTALLTAMLDEQGKVIQP